MWFATHRCDTRTVKSTEEKSVTHISLPFSHSLFIIFFSFFSSVVFQLPLIFLCLFLLSLTSFLVLFSYFFILELFFSVSYIRLFLSNSHLSFLTFILFSFASYCLCFISPLFSNLFSPVFPLPFSLVLLCLIYIVDFSSLILLLFISSFSL